MLTMVSVATVMSASGLCPLTCSISYPCL